MNECQNFKTEYIQLYCLNLNDKKICTGYLPNCHKFSTWEKSHLQEMNPHQPFFMGVHSCFKLMFWNSWQSWVNHKLRILFKWLIESCMYMFAYTVFGCCHLMLLLYAYFYLIFQTFFDLQIQTLMSLYLMPTPNSSCSMPSTIRIRIQWFKHRLTTLFWFGGQQQNTFFIES